MVPGRLHPFVAGVGQMALPVATVQSGLEVRSRKGGGHLLSPTGLKTGWRRGRKAASPTPWPCPGRLLRSRRQQRLRAFPPVRREMHRRWPGPIRRRLDETSKCASDGGGGPSVVGGRIEAQVEIVGTAGVPVGMHGKHRKARRPPTAIVEDHCQKGGLTLPGHPVHRRGNRGCATPTNSAGQERPHQCGRGSIFEAV